MLSSIENSWSRRGADKDTNKVSRWLDGYSIYLSPLQCVRHMFKGIAVSMFHLFRHVIVCYRLIALRHVRPRTLLYIAMFVKKLNKKTP